MTVDLEANVDNISTTLYPDGLGGKAVKTEKRYILTIHVHVVQERNIKSAAEKSRKYINTVK